MDFCLTLEGILFVGDNISFYAKLEIIRESLRALVLTANSGLNCCLWTQFSLIWATIWREIFDVFQQNLHSLTINKMNGFLKFASNEKSSENNGYK